MVEPHEESASFCRMTGSSALNDRQNIQELFGVGVGGDYEMLYDPAVRAPMFRTLAIVAAVCGLLCAAPFLFWDLSEKKHKAIIDELKLRAEAQNIADGHGGESVLSSGEELSAEEAARLEEEAMQQLGTSVNASAAAEEAVAGQECGTGGSKSAEESCAAPGEEENSGGGEDGGESSGSADDGEVK